MKKERIYLTLLLLLAVAFYTYNYMPRKFEMDGGSCYQGISAMIIRFFLGICVILNTIGLLVLFKSKLTTSRILTVISILLWSLISYMNSVASTFEDSLIGIKYFAPFLLVNLFILLTIKKE